VSISQTPTQIGRHISQMRQDGPNYVTLKHGSQRKSKKM